VAAAPSHLVCNGDGQAEDDRTHPLAGRSVAEDAAVETFLAYALEMILTGEAIDAERIGLVNCIVSDHGMLMDTALAIAERIASNGPLAVKAAKLAVHQGLNRSLQEGLALEGALQKQLLQTKDAEEGLRAFAERRRPMYVTVTSAPSPLPPMATKT